MRDRSVIVIIAGGSGTRLWPLSQPNYPKHLLNLTGQNSLLQNTYNRARKITADIFIVPESNHAQKVAEQLSGLQKGHLIVEPGRRGTASCIVLALAKLQPKYRNRTVVFLHADHHITDVASFNRAVKAAVTASGKHKKITLIGLTPAYPSTGLGYIETGRVIDIIDDLEAIQVKRFKEKPKSELAKKYYRDGKHLWNLGLFAGPLQTFLDIMKKDAPSLFKSFLSLSAAKTDEELDRLYLSLKSQPIDTALMEKTHDLLVVPGRFDWADIGSFGDLHSILQNNDGISVKGTVYHSLCNDSLIQNLDKKPVMAIGLEGVVVINSPHGLLVCRKDQAQKVGELVKKHLEEGS